MEIVLEKWKEIPEYEGFYSVSNFGLVKSLERTVIKSNGVKYPIKEKILKSTIGSHGYYTVSIDRQNVLLHRIIATVFIPNPDKKRTVNHKNGIKTDNRIENLEWNTYSENNYHAVDTGLRPLREDIYNSKLNKQKCIHIKELYSSGWFTQQQIADNYGVSISLINGVINGKRWK